MRPSAPDAVEGGFGCARRSRTKGITLSCGGQCAAARADTWHAPCGARRQTPWVHRGPWRCFCPDGHRNIRGDHEDTGTNQNLEVQPSAATFVGIDGSLEPGFGRCNSRTSELRDSDRPHGGGGERFTKVFLPQKSKSKKNS